jgi:hypothetical protein
LHERGGGVVSKKRKPEQRASKRSQGLTQNRPSFVLQMAESAQAGLRLKLQEKATVTEHVPLTPLSSVDDAITQPAASAAAAVGDSSLLGCLQA